MVRKTIVLATLVAGLATFAVAKNTSRAAFRIELRGHTAVLAKDQPVRRGSVVLFHRYPDGRLIGIPYEDVAIVASERSTPVLATGAIPVATGAVPLQPGDAVLLGPTGGGAVAAAAPGVPAGPASPSGDIPARLAVDAQVFPGDLPVPSGQPGQGGTGAMVNGTPIYGGNSNVINPTLQTTSRPAGVPTSTTTGTGTSPVAPNGFPTTSAAPTIDPNGFPTAGTPTSPQTAAQPIGPDGFPTLTPTGTTATPINTGTSTPQTTTGNSAPPATTSGTAKSTSSSSPHR